MKFAIVALDMHLRGSAFRQRSAPCAPAPRFPGQVPKSGRSLQNETWPAGALLLRSPAAPTLFTETRRPAAELGEPGDAENRIRLQRARLPRCQTELPPSESAQCGAGHVRSVRHPFFCWISSSNARKNNCSATKPAQEAASACRFCRRFSVQVQLQIPEASSVCRFCMQVFVQVSDRVGLVSPRHSDKAPESTLHPPDTHIHTTHAHTHTHTPHAHTSNHTHTHTHFSRSTPNYDGHVVQFHPR